MTTRADLAIALLLAVFALLLLSACSSRAETNTEQRPEWTRTSEAAHVGRADAVAKPAPVAKTVPQAYVIKRILEIDGPFRHGDYVWDEEGAPATGDVVITVDLKAETLSVFRDGYEIGAAVILFGADEKPTPTGVYPITQKDADHYSNVYNSAPMPYMLRMTNDGISIHGSEIDWGYATHGCIGVPVAFAKKLFGAVKLGDKIIVTNGEMMTTGDAIPAA